MKLSDYAKKVGIQYKTAWLWYSQGKIEGYKTKTGTLIVTELDEKEVPTKVVIYARVSSHDWKSFKEAKKAYEKEPTKFLGKPKLPLNNLAAVVSNKKGFQPIIVNGKPLKETNQFYNKRKAELQARL